ncbi:hypothetical protein QWY86_09050 [Pedobacter aquatilis]|uniref:hypothetical protein n=1 Tax=Pedobacter aquatilis TaxID=351343 RepID=UPI0025B54247|nr:hypothetical protein [Pedobacter aquatilis]MDN3586812.1 hypothetical protein [Pedobacter aquatilis]
MKKLLFIGMMCFASFGAFSKTEEIVKFQCTAHYYRHHFVGGREYLIYTEFTAGTCAEAMQAAKNIANEIIEEAF